MSSTGGVVAQPALGRAADVWGYPASYLLSAGISAAALPFIARSRAQCAPADFGDDDVPPCRPEEATSTLETQTAEAAALRVPVSDSPSAGR